MEGYCAIKLMWPQFCHGKLVEELGIPYLTAPYLEDLSPLCLDRIELVELLDLQNQFYTFDIQELEERC
jgi:hypothetical protein